MIFGYWKSISHGNISHGRSIWVQYVGGIEVIKNSGEKSYSWFGRQCCRAASCPVPLQSDEDKEWGGTCLFNEDFSANLVESCTSKK